MELNISRETNDGTNSQDLKSATDLFLMHALHRRGEENKKKGEA